MKILISGCSFTGGSDVIHDEETGLIVKNNQTTWCSFLDADVNNIALGGNSNHKISRRMFEELDSSYDYVIVQWTALHRQERYNTMTKQWVNFCNTGHIITNDPYNKVGGSYENGLYDWHTDDFKYMDDTPANAGVEKTFNLTNKAMTAELLYGKSLQDYRIDFLKTVITTQQALQKRNIPFLFTSMSNESHIPTIAMGGSGFDFNSDNILCDYERQLLKEIDITRWTGKPMSFMMGDKTVSHEDGHPSLEGHKLIYNHIKKDMNQ